MCFGATQKSPTPQPVKDKDPVYLHNPFLDGLGLNAESLGRNSLRIDPGARVPKKTDPALKTGNPAATSGFYSVAPGHGPNMAGLAL